MFLVLFCFVSSAAVWRSVHSLHSLRSRFCPFCLLFRVGPACSVSAQFYSSLSICFQVSHPNVDECGRSPGFHMCLTGLISEPIVVVNAGFLHQGRLLRAVTSSVLTDAALEVATRLLTNCYAFIL